MSKIALHVVAKLALCITWPLVTFVLIYPSVNYGRVNYLKLRIGYKQTLAKFVYDMFCLKC
jgi:hypothetical protein